MWRFLFFVMALNERFVARDNHRGNDAIVLREWLGIIYLTSLFSSAWSLFWRRPRRESPGAKSCDRPCTQRAQSAL